MKNINTYILEKFKIGKDIPKDNLYLLNNIEQLFSNNSQFKKHKKEIFDKLKPIFEKDKEDDYCIITYKDSKPYLKKNNIDSSLVTILTDKKYDTISNDVYSSNPHTDTLSYDEGDDNIQIGIDSEYCILLFAYDSKIKEEFKGMIIKSSFLN